MLSNEVPGGIGRMPAGRYLRRAWPMVPAHALRDAFKRRDVKINGARAGESDPVSAGDRIELFLPDRYLPAPVETVFDDGHLIACVKPQGLPVDVDADGIGADTLLSRVRKLHPGAQLCHRLDAQTGGLLLLAKTEAARDEAIEAFAQRRVHKTYRCLVRGTPEPAEKTLRAWLLKDAQAAHVRVLDAPQKGALPIETRYRVLSEEGGLSRLEVEIPTGRTHQIRAQLAHIGHPILGDDKYGDRALNRKYGVRAQRLWAVRLTLWDGRAFETKEPF